MHPVQPHKHMAHKARRKTYAHPTCVCKYTHRNIHAPHACMQTSTQLVHACKHMRTPNTQTYLHPTHACKHTRTWWTHANIWFVSPRANIWEIGSVTQMRLEINDSWPLLDSWKWFLMDFRGEKCPCISRGEFIFFLYRTKNVLYSTVQSTILTQFHML